MPRIEKAYAISDAKISFVSLVDKAANKKQFLITKADDGLAKFTTYGRIVKTDDESHFVTGIVYEPLVEDTDGNYMTEEEITKAAHWFMKNGADVDLQHCFEKAEGAEVVESYVAKNDMEIEDEQIKKGTWLMTMEISDNDVWGSIQKGEITGFSMGGKGSYSLEDVDLDTLEKSDGEVRGLIKSLATKFGIIKKGELTEKFTQRIKNNNFWTAWDTLESTLRRYNWSSDKYEFVEDEEVIREYLEEFNEIIVGILSQKSVTKSLAKAAVEEPVLKAGKSLSIKNQNALKSIYDNLGSFLGEFEEETEETIEKKEANKEMKQKEVEELVRKEVSASMNQVTDQIGELAKSLNIETKEDVNKGDSEKDAEVTAESISKMVGTEISKAMEPVMQALDPIMKSRALPSNLNDSGSKDVKKGADEEHYLHGIL